MVCDRLYVLMNIISIICMDIVFQKLLIVSFNSFMFAAYLISDIRSMKLCSMKLFQEMVGIPGFLSDGDWYTAFIIMNHVTESYVWILLFMWLAIYKD